MPVFFCFVEKYFPINFLALVIIRPFFFIGGCAGVYFKIQQKKQKPEIWSSAVLMLSLKLNTLLLLSKHTTLNPTLKV